MDSIVDNSTATVKVASFPGDGIGPEVIGCTEHLIEKVAKTAGCDVSFDRIPAGAAHYDKHGEALPPSSMEAAKAADAILLSAMGHPDIRYPDGTEIAPQLDLRFDLDLYAGVRPVTVYPGQPSPLKDPRTASVDFVLIRESTEGLFHSRGRGRVERDLAQETLQITRHTSERLFDFAFSLAQHRKLDGRGTGRVTCVDKANVFQAFAFFREIFFERAARMPDIVADTAYVDAMALWMVQRPWDFDVMVTENMFGDILSDLGAGLMGGLGFAPSADIGDDAAVFQPCHGSAPDIAGQGVANPTAMILSGAMMLDWLGQSRSDARLLSAGRSLRDAVAATIADGTVRTRDVGGSASTDEFAAAVEAELA